MSKYTTEVRFICESYAGETSSKGYNDIDNIIADSYDQIFDEYPIFDENYRSVLDCKILKHYYTREICEETVGLWKLRLNTRMAEIMPYYNKLYESELIHFNPLYDIDVTTSHSRREDTSGNASSSLADDRSEVKMSENNSEKTFEKNVASSNVNSANSNVENVVDSTVTKDQTDKFSDTPQGGITGLENDTYLTNARIISGEDSTDQTNTQHSISSGNNVYDEANTGNESNKNKTSESSASNINSVRNDEHTINNTETYLEHVQGKRGGISNAKLLLEFRETFLNIDKMIIDDLADLFFGLWE